MIDFESRQVTGTWRIGGSPDLMQLNPDGHWLWVSGRLDSALYGVDIEPGSWSRPSGSVPSRTA